MTIFDQLKWVVECRHPGDNWFEPIAAFNHDQVAIDYAERCAKNKSHRWEYRVTIHGRVLATFTGGKVVS